MEAAGGAGQTGEADQRTSSGSVGEEARKERSKEEQRRLNQARRQPMTSSGPDADGGSGGAPRSAPKMPKASASSGADANVGSSDGPRAAPRSVPKSSDTPGE